MKLGYAVATIILSVICSVISLIKSRNILHPIFIFGASWSIILFFSSLNLYTLYTPKQETYYDIFVGVTCFILGSCISTVLFRNKGKIDFEYRKDESEINYIRVYFFCIACILYYIYELYRILPFLLTFNLQAVQSLLHSSEYTFADSKIINAISFLFIQPVSFAIPAITATDYWIGNRDKKLLFLTLAMLFFKAITSANRTIVLLFIIYMFIGYAFCGRFYKRTKEYNNFLKQNKKKITCVACLGAIVFVYMSISRGYDQIVRNVYLDVALPPLLFEKWKDNIDYSGFYGNGGFTFFGIIYPILYIIKNILGIGLPTQFQQIYDWIALTDSSWYMVGKTINANAYVTCFWYFYADFRFVGIILGSVLFGFVSCYFYYNALNRKDCKSVCQYCIVFYTIYSSYGRLQYGQAKIIIAILVISLLTYKKRAR